MLARGLPHLRGDPGGRAGDPRALLRDRLRQLEHYGVLTRSPSPAGRGFTPEGLLTAFLDVTAPYAPPSPGTLSPTLWGSEDHVRELFGDPAEFLELSRRQYVERAARPSQYVEFYKETFGPVVATYRSLADRPDRIEALDRDFLDFAEHSNSGPPEGPADLRPIADDWNEARRASS